MPIGPGVICEMATTCLLYTSVFAYHIGENSTPVIDAPPLTMECEVVDIYETEGFDNFICAIVNTYACLLYTSWIKSRVKTYGYFL